MQNYFKTVTLGAFTWRDGQRVAALFGRIRELGGGWIALHFVLLSLCLNFPVMFAIARLSPFELYSRLYGDNFMRMLPDAARSMLAESTVMDQGVIDDFNIFMLGNNYGREVLLPLLGGALLLVLVIQAVFYLCAAFFLGISRMNVSALAFRDRLALAVFSSTLPALAAVLFGAALPTVHLIVFYFIVILITFQRSGLCPNG